MKGLKLSCPECKTRDSYPINQWISCKSCYLLIHLEKLTSGFLELKTGCIEDVIFKLKEFGRVYFILHNGCLIRIDLENLSVIKKFTYNQNDFDQNLIEWQNKTKGIEDRQTQYEFLSPSPPKLDLKFWQTGYDIAMRFPVSLNQSERGYTRENLGGHSEKDIKIFTQKRLDPEFWQIGLLRSQSAKGFYSNAPRNPTKNIFTSLSDEIFGSEILAYLFYLMGFLVIISIIIYLIYIITK